MMTKKQSAVRPHRLGVAARGAALYNMITGIRSNCVILPRPVLLTVPFLMVDHTDLLLSEAVAISMT